MNRIAVLVISLTASATFSQISDPSVNIPVSTAMNHQNFPAIAAVGAGNAIIAWQDLRAGNSDIYARKINLLGQTLWQDDGVPVCAEPGNQGGTWGEGGQFLGGAGSVRLAPDGTGGAIMTWRDDRAGNGDIYSQRIDANGNIIWPAEGVPICTAQSEQTLPRIISDDAGGAIITWEDFRVGNAADIYAQRINTSGTVLWQADGVAVISATAAQRGPQLVSDGEGGAILAWIDLRNGTIPQYDIYAQRLDPSGALLWPIGGVAICRAADDQYLSSETSIIADGSSGAILTWHDERNGGLGFQDIYAQRIDGQGIVQWQTNGVPVCIAPNQQTNPAIAGDGAGGAFIVWPDLRNGNFTLNPYIQRIDATGSARWQENGLLVSTGGTQLPLIISTTSDNAMVLWQDFRGAADLYIQIYDANGAALLQEDGRPFSTAPGTQRSIAPAHISGGHVIAAWADSRNGAEEDIYAEVFSNSPDSQQAFAIDDRFVDGGPGPKFLPLLRNDVLPSAGDVAITIISQPLFGNIVSVESNGV